MKNTLCAAALAVLATGCAAPQSSVGSPASASPGVIAYYCAKDRLNIVGPRLECNWQPSFDEACSQARSSVLERASLAGDPQPAGRCNSGQWLVKAMPR